MALDRWSCGVARKGIVGGAAAPFTEEAQRRRRWTPRILVGRSSGFAEAGPNKGGAWADQSSAENGYRGRQEW